MGRVKLLTNKQVRSQRLPTLASASPKEIREWIGISQAQVARMSGIPRAAIANLESHRYKMSARDGIQLFRALARAIPPESPRERKKTWREAFQCLDFSKEVDRKKIIELESQIEALSKKLHEVKAKAVELDSLEAELKAEAGDAAR